MEGIIINYRRGRKTQKTNQLIVTVAGYDREAAKSLVGKSVVYTCEGKNKKQIKGEVKSTHGSKGAVRVLFERGIPGQAIGSKVVIS